MNTEHTGRQHPQASLPSHWPRPGSTPRPVRPHTSHAQAGRSDARTGPKGAAVLCSQPETAASCARATCLTDTQCSRANCTPDPPTGPGPSGTWGPLMSLHRKEVTKVSSGQSIPRSRRVTFQAINKPREQTETQSIQAPLRPALQKPVFHRGSSRGDSSPGRALT